MAMNFQENKELNRREIEQRKTRLESKVTSLVVTLTTRCNIVCRMCEEYRIPWDMPERTIAEIVSLFPYLEQVIWQGGETLILDYFKEKLLPEASRHPNLRQSIITNGLPITEALAEQLVTENMELTFSIDGATRESYEFIRRGASYEKLTSNLRLVNRVRARKNLKNMSLRMHSVIMKSSYRDLEGFVDFAREYGFDALHLMPIWGNLEGDENIFYRKDEEALGFLRDTIGGVEEKAREYRLNLLNSLPFSGRPREREKPAQGAKEPDAPAPRKEGAHEAAPPPPPPRAQKLLCHMPWTRMVINPAGFVCPACHCKGMAGNVLDKSLAEIWNGEEMQRYRRTIIEGTYEGFCNPHCISGVIAGELRGV
ncbi:MAG: radical SAM protein [Endomicrobiales bacterium]